MTLPPAPSTETAANCAEPANVVAEKTIDAPEPIPAARASNPNEIPNSSGPSAIGSPTLTPSRSRPPGAPSLACSLTQPNVAARLAPLESAR